MQQQASDITGGSADGQVVLVPEPQRVEMFKKLKLGGMRGSNGSVRQFLDHLAGAGLSAEALYAYQNAGKLGQCALVIPQVGRTGVVLVSRPGRRHQDELAQVLRHISEQTDARQVHLLQAMLGVNDRTEAAALAKGGFKRLAELEYQQRSVPLMPEPPNKPEGYDLVRWSGASRADFASTMEASYEATSDCPELQGVREIDDVIAGHQAVGEFDEKLWSLLRIGGRRAGVLLLNRLPVRRAMEVVYLGLAPWARGMGIGKWLIELAVWQTAYHNLQTLILAVDSANAPALRLYQQMGFRRFARKQAWIKVLKDLA